jgi:hypothetical protein
MTIPMTIWQIVQEIPHVSPMHSVLTGCHRCQLEQAVALLATDWRKRADKHEREAKVTGTEAGKMFAVMERKCADDLGVPVALVAERR